MYLFTHKHEQLLAVQDGPGSCGLPERREHRAECRPWDSQREAGRTVLAGRTVVHGCRDRLRGRRQSGSGTKESARHKAQDIHAVETKLCTRTRRALSRRKNRAADPEPHGAQGGVQPLTTAERRCSTSRRARHHRGNNRRRPQTPDVCQPFLSAAIGA